MSTLFFEVLRRPSQENYPEIRSLSGDGHRRLRPYPGGVRLLASPSPRPYFSDPEWRLAVPDRYRGAHLQSTVALPAALVLSWKPGGGRPVHDPDRECERIPGSPPPGSAGSAPTELAPPHVPAGPLRVTLE